MGKKDKKNSKKGSKSDDDEWYHGVLSTAEAERRLNVRGVNEGRYLVRTNNGNPRCLLLSVRIDLWKVGHFPIKGDFSSVSVFLCSEVEAQVRESHSGPRKNSVPADGSPDSDGSISAQAIRARLDQPFSFGFPTIKLLLAGFMLGGRYVSLAKTIFRCILTRCVVATDDDGASVENAAGVAMSGTGGSLRSMSMSGGIGLFRTPSGRAAGPTSSLTGRSSVNSLGGAICGVTSSSTRGKSISSGGGGGGGGTVEPDSVVAMQFRSDPRERKISAAADQQAYLGENSAMIARNCSGQARMSVRAGQMGLVAQAVAEELSPWVNHVGVKDTDSGKAWAAKLMLAKKKPSKTELGNFAVRGHRGADEFVLTLVRGTSLAEVTEHRIAIMDNPRQSTIDGKNYGPFCSVDEVVWVLGQVVMPFDMATGEPWVGRLVLGYDTTTKKMSWIKKHHKPARLCDRSNFSQADAAAGKYASGIDSDAPLRIGSGTVPAMPQGLLSNPAANVRPRRSTATTPGQPAAPARSASALAPSSAAESARPSATSDMLMAHLVTPQQRGAAALRTSKDGTFALKGQVFNFGAALQTAGEDEGAWRESVGEDNGAWAGDLRDSIIADGGTWAGQPSGQPSDHPSSASSASSPPSAGHDSDTVGSSSDAGVWAGGDPRPSAHSDHSNDAGAWAGDPRASVLSQESLDGFGDRQDTVTIAKLPGEPWGIGVRVDPTFGVVITKISPVGVGARYNLVVGTTFTDLDGKSATQMDKADVLFLMKTKGGFTATLGPILHETSLMVAPTSPTDELPARPRQTASAEPEYGVVTNFMMPSQDTIATTDGKETKTKSGMIHVTLDDTMDGDDNLRPTPGAADALADMALYDAPTMTAVDENDENDEDDKDDDGDEGGEDVDAAAVAVVAAILPPAVAVDSTDEEDHTDDDNDDDDDTRPSDLGAGLAEAPAPKSTPLVPFLTELGLLHVLLELEDLGVESAEALCMCSAAELTAAGISAADAERLVAGIDAPCSAPSPRLPVSPFPPLAAQSKPAAAEGMLMRTLPRDAAAAQEDPLSDEAGGGISRDRPGSVYVGFAEEEMEGFSDDEMC